MAGLAEGSVFLGGAYLREYNRRVTLEPAQARHHISNSMGSP
ncbi:hypothetical protein OG203_26740 [Nocardia sp. NBC_01499]